MTVEQFTQFLSSDGIEHQVTKLDTVDTSASGGETNTPVHSVQYDNERGQDSLVIVIGNRHNVVALNGVFV